MSGPTVLTLGVCIYPDVCTLDFIGPILALSISSLRPSPSLQSWLEISPAYRFWELVSVPAGSCHPYPATHNALPVRTQVAQERGGDTKYISLASHTGRSRIGGDTRRRSLYGARMVIEA